MAFKISKDCIACGACIDECPVKAITEGDIYKIDPDICTDCAACIEVCPVDVIDAIKIIIHHSPPAAQ